MIKLPTIMYRRRSGNGRASMRPLLVLSVLLLLPAKTFALSSDDLKALQYDTIYYDDSTAVAGSGSGSCTSLTTPTINDTAALAVAFGKFEDKYTHGRSPLVGHFGEMISGAVAAGYNPMIVLSQALHESTLGTANSTGDTVYNAWGRSASPSQPHATSPNGRLWYAWTSWTDALTGPDNISHYDYNQWVVNYKYTTIDQMLMTYAPPSDGNNTTQYIQDVKDNIAEIVALAGPALSCGGAGQSGVVAGDIVKTALGLAWPDNTHQPQNQATPAYVALNNGKYSPITDCGVFVGWVMRSSGVDPKYPGQGTAIQKAYILAHPEKYSITYPTNTSQLQPGDILIFGQGDAPGDPTGHTLIWVGPQANGLSVAEASGYTRAPMLNIAGNAQWTISVTGGKTIAARVK